MTPRLYDWKSDLTDAEIAQVRRRTLADLAASLRDACDELHKLLSEPRRDDLALCVAPDPRDHAA